MFGRQSFFQQLSRYLALLILSIFYSTITIIDTNKIDSLTTEAISQQDSSGPGRGLSASGGAGTHRVCQPITIHTGTVHFRAGKWHIHHQPAQQQFRAGFEYSSPINPDLALRTYVQPSLGYNSHPEMARQRFQRSAFRVSKNKATRQTFAGLRSNYFLRFSRSINEAYRGGSIRRT